MKRPWIKWCLLVLVVLVALVGVPIIINECYKTNNGYITLWGAADILSYYGMIMAAIVGVIGIYYSIRAANKNYREDVKARVLPFIALTPLDKHARFDVFDMFSAVDDSPGALPGEVDAYENQGYQESKLNQLYFVICAGRKIEPKRSLTKSQYEIIKTCGAKWVPTENGGKALTSIDYMSMPFEIENVGNGTAVNLHIGFNFEKSEAKYIRPMMLKQNQSLYIHIFSTEKFESINGNYMFDLHYEDIYGNKYFQKFPIKLGVKENGRKYQSIELIGRQTAIMEDTTHADA